MTNHQSYRPIEYDEEARDVLPIIPRQVERERGRAVPQAEEAHFEIKLDGQIIGVVYPKRLTAGALMDLEDGVKTRDHIRWLVDYAGGDAVQVEAVLRPLPILEVRTFVNALISALTRAIEMGNESGPR